MKNAVIVFNLIGVLALGVLCVSQWRMDHRLNAEIERLESIRVDQAAKLDEKEKTIDGQTADLKSLHTHITRLTGDLKETEGKFRTADNQVTRLTFERDQLKEAVAKWSEAVYARDDRLREANSQIESLATRCNDTVLKYNELATNHNESVNLLNERTKAYNELVTKLNALAQK